MVVNYDVSMENISSNYFDVRVATAAIVVVAVVIAVVAVVSAIGARVRGRVAIGDAEVVGNGSVVADNGGEIGGGGRSGHRGERSGCGDQGDHLHGWFLSCPSGWAGPVSFIQRQPWMNGVGRNATARQAASLMR